MCVWGAHINIFSGGPQSSSYGPDGRLWRSADSLINSSFVYLSSDGVNCVSVGWSDTANIISPGQLLKIAHILCNFMKPVCKVCITVWYGACNASCRKSLQRIVRAAEKIVGVSLPSLQDIYSTRLTRKALSIAGDPTHPTHSFFSLLPSGRRLRSLQARTSRLKDSFIHQAVRKLNSLPSLPRLPSLTPRTTEL